MKNEAAVKAANIRAAAVTLATAKTETKNRALLAIAEALIQSTDHILAANREDCEKAKADGITPALLDRLTLTEARIADMAEGVRQVAALPDPVGEVMETFTRPGGLLIEKVRVPLGVIGMIYEARPNVTVDSAALALKSGNGILLRGSGSALASNRALCSVIRKAVSDSGLPEDCVDLLEDCSHEAAGEMMNLVGLIDVLIPRGGGGLINNVVRNARVPVIQTGVGNCHIFVDESADFDMALSILLNAKTQRPGVCNAAETLLISEKRNDIVLFCQKLTEAGVTIHGCPAICTVYPEAIPNGEADYAEEYLSLDICVKVVSGLEEAVSHIRRYGTGHTECIVTEDKENAAEFLNLVDAACVNHNASTRFTDGFQFGLGAEIGISTQKMHARGPLGLKELTGYKYLVHGSGQIRK